jgi:hypothetical protein
MRGAGNSNLLCIFNAPTGTNLSKHIGVVFVSLSWTPLVSREEAADAGFLCDKAAVFSAAIRETLKIFLVGEFRYLIILIFEMNSFIYLAGVINIWRRYGLINIWRRAGIINIWRRAGLNNISRRAGLINIWRRAGLNNIWRRAGLINIWRRAGLNNIWRRAG